MSDDLAPSIETTGRIGVGESVTSRIDTPGDVDWLRVELQGGQTYRIDLVGAGGADSLADPLLGVFSASGRILADADDISPTNLNAQLLYTPDTSGVYFVAAASALSFLTGSYTISVNNVAGFNTGSRVTLLPPAVNTASPGFLVAQSNGVFSLLRLSGAELPVLSNPLPTFADWRPQAVVDINADGQSDILVRNSGTGQVGVALAGQNDAFPSNSPRVLGALDQSYQISGAADFAGDGRPELVLGTADGGVAIGILQSDSIAIASIGQFDPTWSVSGVADTNGDGRPDILLRHQPTGLLAALYLDGITRIGGEILTQVDPTLTVLGGLDLDQDGVQELLYQNRATGDYGILSLSDGGYAIADALGSLETGWRIIGTADPAVWGG